MTQTISKTGKPVVQLPQFRRDMRALGYRVRTKANSSFVAATVIDADGNPINNGNVLTSEHLDRHHAFYDYKNSHSVRDGDWIVTI